MKKTFALLFVLLLASCSSEQADSTPKASSQEAPLATQIPMDQGKGSTTPIVMNQSNDSSVSMDQSEGSFLSISTDKAQKIIAEKADLLILDVRTTREIVNEGAIANSQQASLRAIFQDGLTIPKNAPILLVCAVGGRSFAAGQMMIRHGFQEIYNLSGGLSEWKKDGLPVVYPKK